MKKCNFCDYLGHTEKGEKICTKHLIYVGDDQEYFPCEGFTFRVDVKLMIIAIVISTLVLSLIFSAF